MIVENEGYEFSSNTYSNWTVFRWSVYWRSFGNTGVVHAAWTNGIDLWGTIGIFISLASL